MLINCLVLLSTVDMIWVVDKQSCAAVILLTIYRELRMQRFYLSKTSSLVQMVQKVTEFEFFRIKTQKSLLYFSKYHYGDIRGGFGYLFWKIQIKLACASIYQYEVFIHYLVYIYYAIDKLSFSIYLLLIWDINKSSCASGLLICVDKLSCASINSYMRYWFFLVQLPTSDMRYIVNYLVSVAEYCWWPWEVSYVISILLIWDVDTLSCGL